MNLYKTCCLIIYSIAEIFKLKKYLNNQKISYQLCHCLPLSLDFFFDYFINLFASLRRVRDIIIYATKFFSIISKVQISFFSPLNPSQNKLAYLFINLHPPDKEEKLFQFEVKSLRKVILRIYTPSSTLF